MLTDLVRYREYIWQNSLASLRHKYAGSFVGAGWLVAHPFLQVVIYTVVFSSFMIVHLPGREDGPASFAIYLCAGLLPWIAFANILTESTSAILANSNRILRTALPEQVIIAREACTGFIILLLTVALVLGVALALGVRASPAWWFLPLILAPFALFAFGLGMALGVLNVFVRDVSQILSVGLQLWLWMTPIVYVESILPDGFRTLLVLNPAYWFISAIRDSVLYSQLPSAPQWLILVGLATGSVLLGLGVLNASRRPLRDALW